jgi:CO/xanthine dehydrogenase FAD-binding subunit
MEASSRSPELYLPTSLQDASRAAALTGAVVFAGGCELALRLRSNRSTPTVLVNLAGLKQLATFDAHPKKGLQIGGLVKIRDVANHLWIAKRWAALHEAAEQLMPPQIRHMGTVVGNLCAGIPYYDMAVALTALRAEARIYRKGELFSCALPDFYLGSGETALQPGDIVVDIMARPPSPDAGSAFRKIWKIRRHLGDAPKISAASYVALDPPGKIVVDATVVIGACGNSPIRVAAAEVALIGAPASHETYARAGRIAAGAFTDLTDISWLENQRRQIVGVLARDVVEQAASRARSKHNPFDDINALI